MNADKINGLNVVWRAIMDFICVYLRVSAADYRFLYF